MDGESRLGVNLELVFRVGFEGHGLTATVSSILEAGEN